jgi:uncharacterized protein YbjT (DUF2867 family)
MQISITGASGHVGCAVIPELLQAGDEVVGHARSDVSDAALETLGAKVHRDSTRLRQRLQELPCCS